MSTFNIKTFIIENCQLIKMHNLSGSDGILVIVKFKISIYLQVITIEMYFNAKQLKILHL